MLDMPTMGKERAMQVGQTSRIACSVRGEAGSEDQVSLAPKPMTLEFLKRMNPLEYW